MTEQEVDRINDLYKQLDAKDVEISVLKEQLSQKCNCDTDAVLASLTDLTDLVKKLKR